MDNNKITDVKADKEIGKDSPFISYSVLQKELIPDINDDSLEDLAITFTRKKITSDQIKAVFEAR